MDNDKTLGVLKALERGEINAAQASQQLDAAPQIERDYTPGPEETGAPEWVRRLWFYPLIAGLVLVGLGAWVIVATMHANILWLLFGLPILLLGTLVVAVSASAESGHWLYVNIAEGGKRSRNIRFGIPFPTGLLRGGVRLARLFGVNPKANINVSGNKVKFDTPWTDGEEFLDALERELKKGHPLTVDVDDKNDRVQVYIV